MPQGFASHLLGEIFLLSAIIFVLAVALVRWGQVRFSKSEIAIACLGRTQTPSPPLRRDLTLAQSPRGSTMPSCTRAVPAFKV